jgi:hypothetical protein
MRTAPNPLAAGLALSLLAACSRTALPALGITHPAPGQAATALCLAADEVPAQPHPLLHAVRLWTPPVAVH